MNDIAVRKAAAKDAKAACAVLVRSIKEIGAPYYDNDEEITEWLANKTAANVRQWIESDRCYSVVAVSDSGDVVGFSMICGFEIMLNYVVPEALRKAIGKRVLQALEGHAIASGEQIEVVSSIPAKAFYERNGYIANGAPRKVGRIIGDFPLIKRLPDNEPVGPTL